MRFLRGAYGRVIDLAGCEREGRFLESTGSLVLDHSARVAYAALSPRTDRSMAQHWADTLGFRLVPFTATDAQGMPYYHTNVMLFIGHGLAGVCLESIADPAERHEVEISLAESRLELLPITREQVTRFCGNCLALSNDLGERLFVMSTAACEGFTPAQRSTLDTHGRLLHSDLSVFERLGGGSARCLLGELF